MACRTSWPPASGIVTCGLAALPKCPICLMSLLGGSGLGSLPFVMWLPHLLPVSIAVTLLLLVRHAIKDRIWTPLLLGIASSALLIAVSQQLLSAAWITLAAAALVVSAWRVRSVNRQATTPLHVERV
jgi:hypothetical protein